MRRLSVFLDRHLCRLSAPWIPAPYLGTGRAIAGKTKWGRRVDVGGGIAVGALSRDVSAWIPAFAGMTNSEGPELCLGTADSATPHPDPCGGQAPALHFLNPLSAISLQFGRFRPWSAGIEVDWRAHFGTNDESRGRNDEGVPRMTNERLMEQSIPDRGPGHAFIAMSNSGMLGLT